MNISTWITLVRSFRRAAGVIAKAADGDLDQRMTVRGKDELAQMGASFNSMMGDVATTVRGIREVAEHLVHTSHTLDTVSETMRTAAEGTATQLDVVTTSVTQTADEIEDIAGRTDLLRSAISEISTQAEAAAQTVESGVTNAALATTTMLRLRDASRQIGEIVHTVTAITEQTNLLALNATIEAARAGEAGRGFSIVAGEVKELARAAATAAEEIARRIATVQADTGSAVATVEGLAEVIDSIAQYQAVIGSAVTEQSATTAEIASGAGTASAGAAAVVQAATSARDVAGTARATSTDTRRTAGELAATAAKLTELTAAFR